MQLSCWFALVLKSQQRQSSRVGLSSQWAKPKQTTGKAKPGDTVFVVQLSERKCRTGRNVTRRRIRFCLLPAKSAVILHQ